MKISVSFGTIPLWRQQLSQFFFVFFSSIFFLFTDAVQHEHQLCMLSHNTLLICLNSGVKGVIVDIKELFACHAVKSLFSVY